MLSERTSNALTGISKATLKKGVRVKHLFRIMTHSTDLWMQAYANIYANRGALTQGVNKTTLDGMCEARVQCLMTLLKEGRYEPRPAKRVYIPKANGKRRPLGVPTGDDKLVQEVIKILLEQIFEPVFSINSHGFRPERSCHTALTQIERKWIGTKWIVDMDIQGFYDNIDHDILVTVLEKKIDDPKFIRVIKQLLKAGYLDNWKFHHSYSGTPQGGICSPILANIFLNELDEFMEEKRKEFDKGEKRRDNPVYLKFQKKVKHLRTRTRELKRAGGFSFALDAMKQQIEAVKNEARKYPSGDPLDANYRRLHYIRYADDFACGIVGSKDDAQKLSQEITEFLQKKLKLQIASEKSGIRHVKDGFRFLGYDIHSNAKADFVKRYRQGVDGYGNTVYGTARIANHKLQLKIPLEKVWEFCYRKGYLKNGRPRERGALIKLPDYDIVSTFNAEMRGFANYYALAPNYLLYTMQWAGVTSMFMTLAAKHKSSVAKIKRSMKQGDEHVFRYTHKEEKRRLKVFKIKHRMIPKVVFDKDPVTLRFSKSSEILQRIAAGKCEYCGTTKGYFEVHHVRNLKELKRKTSMPDWEARMCARNRKTMVLCSECHDLLHAGRLQSWKRDFYTKMESVVQ